MTNYVIPFDNNKDYDICDIAQIVAKQTDKCVLATEQSFEQTDIYNNLSIISKADIFKSLANSVYRYTRVAVVLSDKHHIFRFAQTGDKEGWTDIELFNIDKDDELLINFLKSTPELKIAEDTDEMYELTTYQSGENLKSYHPNSDGLDLWL
jgi:hypothetical protein